MFVGLVGTGKTTMAKSIANVLGRQLIRIPFGGLGDPLYLRGQSRIHPEAEPGQIIKGLINSKSIKSFIIKKLISIEKNMFIYVSSKSVNKYN